MSLLASIAEGHGYPRPCELFIPMPSTPRSAVQLTGSETPKVTDVSKSVQEDANRFLGCFRDEMRLHLAEFGKHLWQKDSDIFIFMARKAACLFDCLRELNIAQVRGQAVSDRILDMDLTFLRGRKVTLVDDCVFSGTTLFRAKRIVEAAGCERCDTMALSYNKEWLRPALLPGCEEESDLRFVPPLFPLSDSDSVRQCYDVVKALSIVPRPYDVDFPHSLTNVLSESQLDCVLNCSGWRAFDVSSTFQIGNDTRTFTLIPDLHFLHTFFRDFSGANNVIRAAKIRVYSRRIDNMNWSVRLVPMLMLGPITSDFLLSGEFFEDPNTIEKLDQLGVNTASSRYRLLQYLLSHALLKAFNSALRRSFAFTIEDSIREDLAEMIFGVGFKRFNDGRTVRVKCTGFPLSINEPMPAAIADFGGAVFAAETPTELEAHCVQPFTWLYENLEIKARTAVLRDGLRASLRDENEFGRLRKGFSPGRLFARIKSTAFDVERYVSLFLDRAIDAGIAVPTTVEDSGLVFRAFRHGEDAIFGTAEERLSVLALAEYMKSRGAQQIYGLELQKFLVLFVQIAIRTSGLLNRVVASESARTGSRVVSIKGHLHGPVATVTHIDESGSVGTPFVEGNDRPAEWLVRRWTNENILGRVTSGNRQFDETDIRDFRRLAKKISGRKTLAAQLVFDGLTSEGQLGMQGIPNAAEVTDSQKRLLLGGLNAIVNGPSIWSEERFPRIRSRTKSVLKQDRAGSDTRRINRLLLEDSFPSSIVASKRGVQYHIASIPNLALDHTREAKARSIGRCLGRLVGDSASHKERPINHDKDLVLLSTCFEADHQIRALSGELAIVSERWQKTMSQVRSLAKDDSWSEAATALLEENDLYVAVNSGAMKFRWFLEGAFQKKITEVGIWAAENVPDGSLRDDWLVLWDGYVEPSATSVAPVRWNHILAMGQWLITFNITVRLFYYWLSATAVAKGQDSERDLTELYNDCRSWCEIYGKHCSTHRETLFGKMAAQIRAEIAPEKLEIIADYCRTASEVAEHAAQVVAPQILVDAQLLCETFGSLGEFRSYPYAVFIDIERNGFGASDPYAEHLQIAYEHLGDDTKILDNVLNPWKLGMWILVRGNKKSKRASELCYKLANKCLSKGLRFRAVVIGQLSYDDSCRNLAGSIQFALGNFSKRIAELKNQILPKEYGNKVIVLNEVADGSVYEGKKFFSATGRPVSRKFTIESFSEHLPKRKYLAAECAFPIVQDFQGKMSASSSVKPQRLRLEDVRDSIDIGIITVREDEFEAVLARFPDRSCVESKTRSYEISEVTAKNGRLLRVAITKSPEQGESAAQATAASVIRDLTPRWIFLVGIAGAMPSKESTLGDVLLSHRMSDFSVSAAIEGKPMEFQDMGAPMTVEVERLVSGLKGRRSDLQSWHTDQAVGMLKPKLVPPAGIDDNRLYGGGHWRESVLSSLAHHFSGKDGSSRQPDFFAATILTSNTLVKDTELAQQWKNSARQAAGVEMELKGVMQAARYAEDESPNVLAIRGLSDVVGLKREDKWGIYACNTAASFALALLQSGLISSDV